MNPLFERHPGATQLLSFFAYDHLPPFLQVVSAPCHDLAFDMAGSLPDGAELTAGLRKLLEAKDCFVRQALLEHRRQELQETPLAQRNPEQQRFAAGTP